MPVEWRRLRDETAYVYAFVAARTGGDQATAEDVTQEVMLAALRGSFDPSRGSLRGWLVGIAVHRIADHERSVRTSRERLAKAARELVDRMGRDDLPDAWAEKAEMRCVVNQALAALPAAIASLLARRYYDEATVAEIAAEVGASEHAVESQLVRARAAFHQAVERCAKEAR